MSVVLVYGPQVRRVERARVLRDDHAVVRAENDRPNRPSLRDGVVVAPLLRVDPAAEGNIPCTDLEACVSALENIMRSKRLSATIKELTESIYITEKIKQLYSYPMR